MSSDLDWLEAALAGNPKREALMAGARAAVASDPLARASCGIMSAQVALNPDVGRLLRAAFEVGTRLESGAFDAQNDRDGNALAGALEELVRLAYLAFPAEEAAGYVEDLVDALTVELAARRSGRPVAVARLFLRAQRGDAAAQEAIAAARSRSRST